MADKRKADKIRANVRALAGLKPRPERYDTGIEGRPGLVVRVWPSGKRTVLHRFKFAGEPFRVTLGDYPADSLETLLSRHQAQRLQLKRGENPAAEAQRSSQEAKTAPTVKRLAERYMEEHAKPKKRSWRGDQQVLDRDVIPAWGKLQARAITFGDVDSLIESIRKDRKRGATAPRRTLAVVRKMFAFAVKKRIVPVNPARGVDVPAAPKPRERSLTESEIRAFVRRLPLSDLNAAMRNALRLQLLTGARIGEVLGIEWREIDWDAKLWKLPGERSKNGLPNFVPLSAPALTVLKRQQRGNSTHYAFPGAGTDKPLRVDSLAKALARAREGFTDADRKPLAAFTSHDLRRTVETGLARLGVGREVRDRILNHKDRSVSGQHYNTHDYLKEKGRALVAWADSLGRVVRPGKVAQVVPIRREKAR